MSLAEMVGRAKIVHEREEGLRHGFRVRIGCDDLETRLSERVGEMSPRMNLRGFRPGKVPASHLRRVYGEALLQEIVEEFVRETGDRAFADAGFRPAGPPEITLESDVQTLLAGGVDLEYSMQVEAVPEFEVADLSGLKLERLVPRMGEKEIESSLAEVAKSCASFHPEPDRVAARGDRVLFALQELAVFESVQDARDSAVVIGQGEWPEEFENLLLGARAGDERRYEAPGGSQAHTQHFRVSVKEVQRVEIPAIDDELAKKLGLASLEELRAAAHKRTENEMRRIAENALRNSLFDALLAAHDFPVPEGLVAAEIDELKAGAGGEGPSGGADDSDAEIAGRRVRLGLIVGRIAESASLEVSQREMDAAIVAQASAAGARRGELERRIRGSAAALARIRSRLLEGKAIDYLLARAEVSEKKVTVPQLASALATPSGHREQSGDGDESA